MPRILVVSDTEPPQVCMNEQVTNDLIDDHFVAEQIIERLAWSLADAERIENPTGPPATITHLPRRSGVEPYGELTG